MKIERFEDILAWQKAQVLTTSIYQEFSGLNDFSFLDQIRRAVISIPNNIAEGFDRKSDKEFARFLFIAKSSCSEVKSMLYTAQNLKYITLAKGKELQSSCDEISKMISGLIKYLSS